MHLSAASSGRTSQVFPMFPGVDLAGAEELMDNIDARYSQMNAGKSGSGEAKRKGRMQGLSAKQRAEALAKERK